MTLVFIIKRWHLRNAYDVFLLSKKTNAKDAMIKLDKLSHPLNCFLAACYEVFDRVDSLEYNKTKKVVSYLSVFNTQFSNSNRVKRRFWRRNYIIKIYLYLRSHIVNIYKNFLDKDFRIYFFKRLTDKNWYIQKLIQLGIK